MRSLRARPSLAPLLALVALAAALPYALVTLVPGRFYVVIDVAPYLVFHNIAEFFSVMVSFSVFGLGWFSFARTRDRHTLLLSAAFLAIGLLDFMHTLGYAGMPDFFTPNTPNKASQFWVAARYGTAGAFVAGAFVQPQNPCRWLRPVPLLALALGWPLVVAVGILAFPDWVPLTSVPGVGLTPFKVVSEYLIIGLFGVALWGYGRKRKRTGDPTLDLLLAAFVLCIFSEQSFTLYKSDYDTYNMLGHLYKIVAFVLVYRSLYVAAVHRPYDQLKATNELLAREVAERTQAEAEIRQALREKEALVRELYHRTSNTIQVVRGMLSLQAAEVPGERAVQDLVARTEARIEAIALVHELLFSHQDLSRIPAQAYVTNLTDFLVREGAAPGRITVNLEADDLPIILDTAVPFGLILNELVTNSLRWAFPGDRTGTITITLTRSGPGRVRFTYADDGVGVPEGFDFHRTPSLGLTLVRNLGSDQMLGTVRFENRGGVHFSLDFPDNLYRPRV